MLTDEEIAAGQAIAESTLDAECAVIRQIGTTVDPNSGAQVYEYATVYTGPCALKMTSESTTPEGAGEQPVTLTRIRLDVPATQDGFQVNDRARIITASRSPGQVGRELQITTPWVQTTSSVCRYPCEESTIPETP